ncbi:MAG: protein kinase [Planctomycetota bacterium]
MTQPTEPPDPSRFDATRMAPPSGPSAGGAAVRSGGDTGLTSIGGYHLVRRIGSGGMGSIYLAVQASVGRQVAIKVLSADEFDNALAVERFEREVKVLGQLSHPNICPVLEAGLEGRTYFYVMEHLKGLDISKVLRTQRMDPRRAAAIAAQVGRALQYAHERGIVHRDVKPLNVMLVRGDRLRSEAGVKPAPLVAGPADDGLPSPEWVDKAVLIDFGLARDKAGTSALTVSGAVIGTPAYMAPEQARGDRHAVAPATDVWALGVMLYEMLALKTPFEGESVGEILNAILNADPTPLRRHAPDVDPDLETIVQHAMEKEPARRYASAGEMADDLDRWLAGEPVRARRASLGYRIRRRVSRNKLASVAIAAAAALAAAGLWMGFAPGEIRLDGDLAGASVTLNGHPRTGPALRVWPPGTVRVEVAREGFRTFSKELDVKARSSVPVAVTMPSLFGSIRIESTPPGAEASSGGALLGRTPCVARLPIGLREIRLRAPLHGDHVESVEVESGVEKPHRASLTHETGTLFVECEPAELGLDLVHRESGEALFTAAPAKHIPLKTGHWTGFAHAENRWRRALAFEVRTGEEAEIGITLPEMVIWKHTSDPMHLNWVAGDVNGDRTPDILVANGKPGRLRALDGRTGRLLWIHEGLPDSPALSRPIPVDIADLDGDLRPEVVFGGGGEVTVLDGASGKRRSAWPVPGCAGAMALGDHDGDGRADVLAWSASGIGLLRGLDGKRLWWMATLGDPIPPWPMPARLNADAFPDVILHDTGRVVGVDGRDGKALWIVPHGSSSYHFTADLNADGFDDAWLAHAVGSNLDLDAISGVDGSVLWTYSQANAATAQPTGGAADLDGDGSLEIVQQREESIHIFSCTTKGPVKVLPIPASWPRPVFLDLTGDGRPEILIPSGSSVLGIDATTWSEVWRFDLESKCTSTPLLADFDGDGRQDIAVQSEAGVISVVSAFESPLLWRHGHPHYWTEQPVPDADPARTLFVPGVPTRLLNASDGRSLAEWSLSGHFRAVAARRDGVLRFLIEGQGMALVDPGVKKEIWRQPRYRGWTRPLVTDLNADGTDDAVWGGDQFGGESIVEAFDGRDGATLWKKKFARQPGAGVAAAGGLIWVPGRDGRLHALAPGTGEEAAAFEAGGVPTSVAAAGDDVVFGTQKGTVARLRKAEGIVWSRALGIALHTHSPVVAGDFVGVSGIDGAVALLDARDGTLLWRRNLDLPVAGPPALRDLDNDGRPEAAIAGSDGLVMVLGGRDGSRLWAWNLRATVGTTVPVWCDLTGDNRPELLIVTRDARLHALTVDLNPRPVVHWSRPWQRSVTQAAAPGRDEAARVRARDAWRDGAWAEALAAGREGATAEAAWYAGMAASRLGDGEALLKHAAEARARGCRRLDLEVEAAAVLSTAEVEQALRSALESASIADVRAAIPPAALATAWRAAALRAQQTSESSGDWPRAIALAASGSGWEAVTICFSVATEAGADGGVLLLARGRAALSLNKVAEGVSDLREAARQGSAVLEAREDLRALELQSDAEAAEAARAYGAGDGPRAARLAERAALVRPENPERWNSLAWYLATSKGATLDDGRRAVHHARLAVVLTRRSGDTSGLAGILDTLAAAHATAGEFEMAARTQREALGLEITEAERAEFEKRLKEYQSEAAKSEPR